MQFTAISVFFCFVVKSWQLHCNCQVALHLPQFLSPACKGCVKEMLISFSLLFSSFAENTLIDLHVQECEIQWWKRPNEFFLQTIFSSAVVHLLRCLLFSFAKMRQKLTGSEYPMSIYFCLYPDYVSNIFLSIIILWNVILYYISYSYFFVLLSICHC